MTTAEVTPHIIHGGDLNGISTAETGGRMGLSYGASIPLEVHYVTMEGGRVDEAIPSSIWDFVSLHLAGLAMFDYGQIF